MVNRKLVRPNLAQIKSRMGDQRSASDSAPRTNGGPGSNPARRRPAPAEATNAEAFYYLKQMNTQTPMIVVLDSGEQLQGHIEWYDRGCLKVHRPEGPNLLVFKHCIRYLYKADEEAIHEDE